MEVVGVRVEMPSNQPIVLLKEINGNRFLPIWVGAVEATAIAFAQQGVEPPRPLTHDLLKEVIEGLAATLTAVHITEMREGVFFADLLLRSSSGEVIVVSARPSDALALALRTMSNILVESEVLDSAGIEMREGDENQGASVDSSQELARFREFLDHIKPEDFAG